MIIIPWPNKTSKYVVTPIIKTIRSIESYGTSFAYIKHFTVRPLASISLQRIGISAMVNIRHIISIEIPIIETAVSTTSHTHYRHCFFIKAEHRAISRRVYQTESFRNTRPRFTANHKIHQTILIIVRSHHH